MNRATQLGQAGAGSLLGYMYEKGKGAPVNRAEAQRWYQKAVTAGTDGARKNSQGSYFAK